jgi:DNA-binding CsgD family transcriptional regulator
MAIPAEARQGYENALYIRSRTRAAYQIARTHLVYGEWLRRQRRRREARDQLRMAHDMFDGMGMHGLAERARLELRASGEHLQKREPNSGGAHPQESQIATLAGRGVANRDIVAQLFISPSTVQYHLHKVFRKLGGNSRTQLAHRVINHGASALHPIPAPSVHASTDAANPAPAVPAQR